MCDNALMLTNMMADAAIAALLGPDFPKFQKLALMVKEQPATRPFAEQEMRKVLEAWPIPRRKALGAALIRAGKMKRR
jgi:hypothetical protein